MIISLKEDFDRELGTSLPMISRAGKSTIPQHLCFNNAPGNRKEFNFTKKDEDSKGDDFSLLLGDKKQTDLATEMTKITEQERKKSHGRNSRAAQKSTMAPAHMRSRTTGGFFVPFDLQEEAKKKGHQKSSSFYATSREQWETSHASKTNPPDVGKYKPKFSQVERSAHELTIRPPPFNFGTERIGHRELQHSTFCEKIIHDLSDRKPASKAGRGVSAS
mgnify:CR=1 FL=1